MTTWNEDRALAEGVAERDAITNAGDKALTDLLVTICATTPPEKRAGVAWAMNLLAVAGVPADSMRKLASDYAQGSGVVPAHPVDQAAEVAESEIGPFAARRVDEALNAAGLLRDGAPTTVQRVEETARYLADTTALTGGDARRILDAALMLHAVVTPDQLASFKRGWEAADARGDVGNRVRAGFQAAGFEVP